MRNEYARGFEDGVSLCFAKANDAKTLEEVRGTIEKIWAKLEAAKIWTLDEQTGSVWREPEKVEAE